MMITKQRLEELERAEEKLQALESGGVDNWEGYCFSLEAYRAKEEHNDSISCLISDLTQEFGECAYEPSERGAGIAFNDDSFEAIQKVLKDHNVVFGGRG